MINILIVDDSKLARKRVCIPIIAIISMFNEKIKQTLISNGLVYVMYKLVDVKLFNILLNKILNNFMSHEVNSKSE